MVIQMFEFKEVPENSSFMGKVWAIADAEIAVIIITKILFIPFRIIKHLPPISAIPPKSHRSSVAN
ncbi:MAG: hypothetical protein EBS69_10225 [Verrucomicrobia bacterium]|nr:hypothetical protein [Verrucomicrobiota bacterium]NBS80073.1 hypothetical protein [bacterium]